MALNSKQTGAKLPQVTQDKAMSEHQIIDARGAYCPGPLMELIAALKLSEIGDEIEVWSSDKGSIKDIPEWLKKVGHQLVAINTCEGYSAIVVRKTK